MPHHNTQTRHVDTCLASVAEVLHLVSTTVGGADYIGVSHFGADHQSKSAWQPPRWAQRNALESAYTHRMWRQADGVGIRLLTFTEDVVSEMVAEHRTGKVAEAAHLLGLIADIDSNQRRIRWPAEAATWDDHAIRWWFDTDDDLSDLRDFRPYVPTIARALEMATSVAPPTLAIDTGGGLACAWLLSEAVDVPSFGARAASRLTARWSAAVGDVVTAAGWYFDTPPGVGWLRLPGSRRTKLGRYYGHLTATAAPIGPRYSLAEIEAIVGPDSGEPVRSYSGSYGDTPMTWVGGAPIPGIPRPTGRPAQQPTNTTHTAASSRRGRGTRRGKR